MMSNTKSVPITQEILDWAHNLINSREPDFIVGDNQLYRWFVLPRNDSYSLYLHQFQKSDEDFALHDHPYNNGTWLLEGHYKEHFLDGTAPIRYPGEVIQRPAQLAHRIELFNDEKPISLFSTGPRIREWGFYCPQGWRPWHEFIDPNSYGSRSLRGKGCE